MAKYSIELAGPHNERFSFAPAGANRLRGRWDFANTAHKLMGEELAPLAAQVRVVPGLILTLDTNTKTGTVVDPLEKTEQGRNILSIINTIRKGQTGQNDTLTGESEQVHKELTQDQIKEWMYYMRALLDANNAILVPGSEQLPSMEDIRRKVPGKRRREPYSISQDRDREAAYIDIVEDKKAATAAN